MNHSKITLSQALDGYRLAAEARHLSSHTLADYFNTYRKFQLFLASDPPIASITPHQVESFLAAQPVSNKTVLNYHTGLSALWTWAIGNDLVDQHILHRLQRPRPQKPDIVPFTRSDIEALLAAVNHTSPYTNHGHPESSNAIPSADRNRAILLLLLDTGIRASELCELTIVNTDLRNRHIRIFGKGEKERTLPFSARTGQALWRCMLSRKNASLGETLFVTALDRPMNRDRLLKLLANLGRRAGIPDVHPHRFRHTFAVNYLRNGGDAFSLQVSLGHETMEMVRTYLKQAQADLDSSHLRASPVDRWKL